MLGMRNDVDPARLKYDQDTGAIELAEAVNIDIDDTGRGSRRKGQALISSGEFLTAFCDGGDCFTVQDRTSDSAIMRLSSDMTTLSGVRSGLTKGAMMSFCQVGAKTYYANGYQNGFIDGGVSYPWPDESSHVGAETVRSFVKPPVGNHIAWHMARMWIAAGNIIWITEPYTTGKVDSVRGFIQLHSDVIMLRPVRNGAWVSVAGKGVGFISTAEGATISEMRWISKTPYSAHEWSDCTTLVDLSQTALQVPGMSAVWSSNAGLCVGTENGDFISVTEKKLIYPKGSSGASVADGHNIINIVF